MHEFFIIYLNAIQSERNSSLVLNDSSRNFKTIKPVNVYT